MDDKKDLRKRAKENRRHFFSSRSPQDLIELEKERLKILWKLDIFQNFLKKQDRGAIGFYWAIKDEASTTLVMEKLLSIGCSLALPRVEGPRPTGQGDMHFHNWSPQDILVQSTLGILEPSQESCLIVPDLCIVPLLAFDQNKNRLGYGKGHYDRYFAKHPPIVKIGWSYGCQKVGHLLPDPHDIPLDEVVYGS